MVQNKEVDGKALANGEIKKEDCESEKTNGEVKLNGDRSEYDESDDDDYLDHLLMVPPIDANTSNRNKHLVSKTLLDFCLAIESRKEYQKIRQELLQNCVPIECKHEEQKIEPNEDSILNGKVEIVEANLNETLPEIETEPNEVNHTVEQEVPEIRRQSIRLKKAMFVPEHEPVLEHDQFFVCRRCTIFFRTRKLRKQHNLMHHRRKINGLPIGNEKHKQRQRRSSANKDPFICDLCQKLYKQKALLRSHMNTHQTEPQFFCTLCPYASKRNNDLKKHHAMHHNPDRIVKKRIRKRQCEKCEEVLDGKKAFKLHMREKHPPATPVKKPRIFQKTCEKCEEVLNGMRAYRLHLKLKHSEMSAVRCETCHRKFKTNFRLKKHQAKYAESGLDCRTYFRQNGEKATFDCQHPSCEKKFLLKSHLTLHTKKHLSLTCDKCNVTFKNKFNLKWHEFSHLEIEPKCSNCAVNFTSEQKFAVHLKKKVCMTNGLANGAVE